MLAIFEIRNPRSVVESIEPECQQGLAGGWTVSVELDSEPLRLSVQRFSFDTEN
jgi:hypothetical protein